MLDVILGEIFANMTQVSDVVHGPLVLLYVVLGNFFPKFFSISFGNTDYP
jgi:hypothetical protein